METKEYYAGTLRITNPATLKIWMESGRYQAMISEGYIYAEGCGRFRKEQCKCSKCRKVTNKI